MHRRKFIKRFGQLGLGFSILGLSACGESSAGNTSDENGLFFRLSLAQWSLHKAIRDEGILPILDFADRAKTLGFAGVEYVSQLYDLGETNRSRNLRKLARTLEDRSDAAGVENVLIMVDGEGDLAAATDGDLETAIDNHRMWVDAAAATGCSSVRVNLYGYDFPDDPLGWHTRSVEGLGKLTEYAAREDINVIVENHGGHSSHAARLAAVIKELDMEHCGTLPDFGNFCIRRDTGDLFDGNCIEKYNKYHGIRELMPYAKGVSAKSYDFNEAGEETTIDFRQMLEIVKASGYSGFIGVEYEGDRLSEEEGIRATRDLLLQVGAEMSGSRG